MVRSRGIENIERDLTGNLQQDFNIFIRAALFDLSNQGSENTVQWIQDFLFLVGQPVHKDLDLMKHENQLHLGVI